MRRLFITILLSLMALMGCVGVPPEHQTSGPQQLGYGSTSTTVPLGIPDVVDAGPTETATDAGAPADIKDTSAKKDECLLFPLTCNP